MKAKEVFVDPFAIDGDILAAIESMLINIDSMVSSLYEETHTCRIEMQRQLVTKTIEVFDYNRKHDAEQRKTLDGVQSQLSRVIDYEKYLMRLNDAVQKSLSVADESR